MVVIVSITIVVAIKLDHLLINHPLNHYYCYFTILLVITIMEFITMEFIIKEFIMSIRVVVMNLHHLINRP